MTETKPKLNASQRLETLEVNVQELLMYMNNMARDLNILREAIKLLGNKTDAIQKASNISDDTVVSLMIDNNAKELEEKVSDFVSQGVLQTSETIDENSFVVVKELNDDGTVANKRAQFVVGALKEHKDKLMGLKVGDTTKLSEGTMSLQIDEVYTIVPPPVDAPAEA